jgi:hypothetical protein
MEKKKWTAQTSDSGAGRYLGDVPRSGAKRRRRHNTFRLICVLLFCILFFFFLSRQTVSPQ